jgi:predicted nucleic acid-binding Zn finger protein
MDLRTYLFINRINQYDFAKLCNCSKITISLIVNGKRPGKRIATAIEIASKGVVRYPDVVTQTSIKSIDLKTSGE